MSANAIIPCHASADGEDAEVVRESMRQAKLEADAIAEFTDSDPVLMLDTALAGTLCKAMECNFCHQIPHNRNTFVAWFHHHVKGICP